MSSDENTPHFPHKIYLIRHGETAWSKSRQHTGRTDIPLTEHGLEEAKALRGALSQIKFKKVFCSPLKRVRETCELAGLIDQATISDDLYEWDYGDYEGITTKEIRKRDPDWNLFRDGVPGGESITQVSQRADHILSQALKVKGDVALFSSGHMSRIIGARWLKFPPSHAQFLALSTASISILSYEHEWRVIHTWNDTSHLKNSR